MRDWHAFNEGVVEGFRANGGVGPGRWANQPLLLLTTIGAKSGQPRTIPLIYSTDGDRYVVIASKGGEPTHPDWYRNLVANPNVTLEVGGETFPCASRGGGRRRTTPLVRSTGCSDALLRRVRAQIAARDSGGGANEGY